METEKDKRGKVSTTEDVTEIEEENLPNGCMDQTLASRLGVDGHNKTA